MKISSEDISKCINDDLSAERILAMITIGAYITETGRIPSENDVMVILKNKVSKKIVRDTLDYAIRFDWVTVDGSRARFEAHGRQGTAQETTLDASSGHGATGAASKHEGPSASPTEPVLPGRDSVPPDEVSENETRIWARWLCREMAINVKSQYQRTGTKVPSNFLSTEKNRMAWVTDMERIIRIDKRSPKEIFDLMKWIDADQFWSVNILSPSKLREKYDNLILKSKAGKKKSFRSKSSSDYEDPEKLARERGLL